jgi:hypothetical protein
LQIEFGQKKRSEIRFGFFFGGEKKSFFLRLKSSDVAGLKIVSHVANQVGKQEKNKKVSLGRLNDFLSLHFYSTS